MTSSCSQAKRAIDNIDVQNRQISFRLLAHDPAYPFGEVDYTLALSDDGKTLEGRVTAYDKNYMSVGDHAVRWMRKE
jgi:hypothetical protein